MKIVSLNKIIFMIISGLFIFWLVCLLSYENNPLDVSHIRAANFATQNVDLTTTVNSYLNFTISSGGSINLGHINADIPACNVSGTVLVVATNADNGYKITPADGSDTNSVLKHTDGETYIPDISASMSAPSLWENGTTKGLGTTLWSGTQREEAWSVGGVALDACAPNSTKWAGVSADDTTVSGHIVTGYVADPDETYWGWKIDIPTTQKTGEYAGLVTFTVVAVLL